MKKLRFISILIFGFFMIASCNQQQDGDDEFYEETDDNEQSEEDLVAADFEELENKMDEIMYESDDSEGDAIKDVVVIKPQGAKKVKVELNIGAGRLKLGGGANELLTAGFKYSEKEWRPEIDYRVNEKKGTLKIKQPKGENFNVDDDDKYVWNLKFNEEMPLDFNVELGAGVSEIQLSNMHIGNFHMAMGVGKTELDLRGNWYQDAEIHLDGGIGLTKLYLPDNVGIRLKTNKILGDVEVKNLIKKSKTEYVNKAYENASIVLNIYIKTGIGKIEVE